MLQCRFINLILLGFLFYQAPAFGQLKLKSSGSFTGNYIVHFDSDSVASSAVETSSELLTRLKKRQADLLNRLADDLQDIEYQLLTSLWINQSILLYTAEKNLAKLRQLPYVRSVRAEQHYQQVGKSPRMTARVLNASQLDQIQLNQLWDLGFKGQGVVIAVLDSGVDLSHTALANRWRGGSNSWFDPYGENDTPLDLSGHGTAVTSLILGGDVAGKNIGVASESRFIAARIFNNQGGSTESAIHAVFQWLLDPDGDPNTDDYPDIVNNSWGIVGSEGACDVRYKTDLELLAQLGIDIVFAAGNSGDGVSTHLIPTFDANVISVGAVDDKNSVWLNSGRGPNRCVNDVFPSLVASGVNLKAAGLTLNGLTSNKLESVEGTSFSAPLVSGALALLRSHFKSSKSNANLFQQALFDATTDLGVLGNDDDYGRGLLNINKADTLLAAQIAVQTASTAGFGLVNYQPSESLSEVKIQVLRSGDVSGAAQVRLQTVDGSAVAGSDYRQHSILLSFQPGESFKIATILLLGDDLFEGDEYFWLRLSDNSNTALAAQTELKVTLLDDEVAGNSATETVGGALNLFWLLSLLPLCFRRKMVC